MDRAGGGKKRRSPCSGSLEDGGHAVLDELCDLFMSFDETDLVTYINGAGARTLGYDSPEEVVGRKAEELWFDPAQYRQFLQRSKSEGSIRDFEMILKKRGGEPVFGLGSATQAHGKKGRPREIHAFVKDISEFVKLQKKLYGTNLLLEEANRKLRDTQVAAVRQEKLASIGQLAAGIAHEINNPLAYLKSNFQTMMDLLGAVERYDRAVREAGVPALDAVRKDLNVEQALSDIGDIVRESGEGFKKIIDIVQNLRAFSRVDAQAEMEWFDLNQAVLNTIDIARSEISRSAEVRTDLGEVPRVLCQGLEINQVILNLLLNSVQAIAEQGRGEGRGLIAVRTWSENGRAFCEIGDDGPGIPLEIQNRVFEPFFTTKPPGKGTGLGLSICYDVVVKKLHGAFEVRSTPGNGAVFTFSLPVTQG